MFALILLVMASCAMAQPVWGPYGVHDSESRIEDLGICARADTADVVWIEDSLALHLSSLLSNGDVVVAPSSILELTGWEVQEFGDCIALADGWACLIYQDQHGDTYTPPNTGSNITDLVISDGSGTRSNRVDDGFSSWYFPLYGESQNWGFSLHDLHDGRIAAAWMDYLFLKFDPDVHPTACLVDRMTDSLRTYWAGEQTFGGWDSPAIVFNGEDDTLSVLYSDGGPAVCLFDVRDSTGYPSLNCNSFEECPDAAVVAAGRTSANRLLALTEGWNATFITPVTLVQDSSGNFVCETLPPIAVAGHLAWAFHPSYGFAALQINPGNLMLARIDTAGNEVQPVGTLYATDGPPFVVDADVTITDDGKVVAVWSEYSEWSEGPRVLKIAWTNWTTYLDTPRDGAAPLPHELALSAYPNPFNSTVTIRYDLPQAGHVELAVYDLQGRLVETLRDEFAQSGSHELKWSPRHAASGVYLARMTAQSGQHTAKLLYLR